MIFDYCSSANSILILEDKSSNTVPILSQIIRKSLHNDQIHFFCYQRSLKEWKSVLNFPNIKFHNCFEKSADISHIVNTDVVIIDSINQLAVSEGWDFTIKLITELQNKIRIRKLITRLQLDSLIFGPKMKIQLKHLTQLHLNMSRSSSSTYLHTNYNKGGKITKISELIEFQNDTIKCSYVTKKGIQESEVRTLPQNIASFKIDLKDDEKQARDSLELPYTAVGIREQTIGQGRILYIPDVADDWDDEDPDDDLDI